MKHALVAAPSQADRLMTSVPKFAAVGSKLQAAQFALDPSEGEIVADTS
jgi:hypothetical protein